MHVVIQLLPLCVCQFSFNSNTFQRKSATEEKSGRTKKQRFSPDARPILLSIINSWVKGNEGSWDFTCSLVNYLQYVCAKFHPNWTTFRRRGLARKKVVKAKNTNFNSCSTYSASNDQISGQMELRKLKLCMQLVSYYHYVRAKFQPNRTFFRVKGLARKKVVKSKSTNYRRFLTYSASNDKISAQRELRKLKLCMYLIKHFHHVCAKFHPNRTNFMVRGLAKKKVVKSKSTNYTRWSTCSDSRHKILSQVQLKKKKLCM